MTKPKPATGPLADGARVGRLPPPRPPRAGGPAMAQLIHTRPAGPHVNPDSIVAGRALLSCLPMLLIVGVLVAAGGTQAGLIAPAVVVSAVVGLLMFGALNDRPPR